MVDNGRTAGFLVHEQEEIVSDQFHLIQCLIDGHRLRDMQLATDDDRSVAYLDLDGLAWTKFGGDGVGRAVVRLFDLFLSGLLDFRSRLDDAKINRDRIAVATTMILATITGATQTEGQLVESHVQSAELVGA